MDDLGHWRWRIGRFCHRGPRGKKQWDPYGGRRKLSFPEVLVASLCLIAAVLAAYDYLEEENLASTRASVRCHSILDSQDWRRRRGFWCSDDAVSSGLTLGGVWTVSAFSAWGVHELYRRLRLLWGKDIEQNPGPQIVQQKPTPQDAPQGKQDPSSLTPESSVSTSVDAGVFTRDQAAGGFLRAAEGERAVTSASADSAGGSETGPSTADSNTSTVAHGARSTGECGGGGQTTSRGTTPTDKPTEVVSGLDTVAEACKESDAGPTSTSTVPMPSSVMKSSTEPAIATNSDSSDSQQKSKAAVFHKTLRKQKKKRRSVKAKKSVSWKKDECEPGVEVDGGEGGVVIVVMKTMLLGNLLLMLILSKRLVVRMQKLLMMMMMMICM